ncbi:hypothetical protein [Actinokineospora enzanensis]|uniref:hypothetical protein n=1 Tax=Actinokineospora enzanensis TaxID=155975 RepID=UPI0012EC1C95|nr:hypothetical protein [Actinokineospora enzanensis]
MARTAIPVQLADTTGAELTFSAVDASAAPNGNSFLYDGGPAVVLIKNADTASHTMTVPIPLLVDGQTVTSRTVTIPAGKTYRWRPSPVYRQQDGNVYLNFDAATSMTVAVVDL